MTRGEIPLLGGAPLLQMITNTTVGGEEGITEWETGIGEVISTLVNDKIVIPRILVNHRVCRTALPSTQDVHKQHCKIASCKDILADKPLSVTISRNDLGQYPGVKMGPVYGTTTIAKIWVEFGVPFYLGWCLVGRKMDMFLVE
jgi:hypothetical protein